MRKNRHLAWLPSRSLTAAAAVATLCVLPVHAAKPEAPPTATAVPAPADATAGKPAMTMGDFLDRLMQAESSGRDDARNPLSTAVGPFQFIESTWLDLAPRLFATEIQGLSQAQVLALRSNRAYARRAAEAYTKDNAATLKAAGIEPTFPHLRLAFLLGPQGAIRVLQAQPETRVTLLLGPAVARANPFMYGLTASGLAARAARDLAVSPSTTAGIAGAALPAATSGGGTKPRPPRVVVRCNLDLPACRRWQSLALARLPAEKGPARKQATVTRDR